MESWTLKGDSYSFMRSAPRTISLRNREGTPNHVEIFDITNIPSPRSAISETTCLCDIFGDDRDSPSLSSSPASAAFVPPPREVDRGAAASPLVDDSSGSYHTAHGSSEGEEGFEDPKERLRSPTLPTGISEGEDLEGHNQTSEHSGLSEEIPKLESVASPPLPILSTESASLEVLNAVSTSWTPSPRHNSPETLKSAEDRGISSSPSSSLSSHRASSPSRSPQPSNLGASLSSIESQLTPSLLESSGSPKGSLSSSGSRKSSLSSEQRPQSSDHLRGLTPPTFEPRVIFSSNSTSRSSVDIYRQSGERSTTPESRDYSYSPDTQDCSPFSELRGRVSVHDLFSRSSTPDTEGSPCTPELISSTSLAGGDTPENQDTQLSAEAKSAASTPLPRYTPPSPVSSIARPPECRGRNVSPAVRDTPSPALSPGVPHTSPTSDSLSQALSPVPYSLPSREVSDYCPKGSDYTTSSPEIRVTASSPEVRRRESLEENLALNSEDHSQCSRVTTSSPHITGLCYSVIQPEDEDTATYTDIAHLSTSEPIWRKPQSPEPKQLTLSPKPRNLRLSPEKRQLTPSPQPMDLISSPEKRQLTPSPQPRNLPPSPEKSQFTPSPQPRDLTPSPEKSQFTPSPQPRDPTPSPVNIHCSPSPEPIHFAPSPLDRHYSPMSEHLTPSPQQRHMSHPPCSRHHSPQVTDSNTLSQSPEYRSGQRSPLAPSAEPRSPGRESPNCTRREMESERKREERLQEKREGRKAHASYRGQQVELSFSARNRKRPESHSTASTGKQTSKGMLTAHSYSERLLATRQPQQQQRRGGPTQRLQPSVPQNMNVASGRVSKNRPRQSSSSSMGSELDEADSEVKWFTDGAFHSLSSPEIDYLDMYNSSHRSSTNISQPSTQESPAGASASLIAYADFRGSGQRLDNEDFPFQPTTYYSDGLDPAKRYELGSFECVDVAVEREEPRKGRRGVPKRQIQLKRKNMLESRQDESSENGSPVVPGMADSPSFQGSLKETLLRQHSTPVTMHESYHCVPSTDIPEYNKKTFNLQKSTSLDETYPKTKMATCLIKSVLSKKMQSVDREEPKGEGTFFSHKEKSSSPIQADDTLEKSTKDDTVNLSSSLKSECSLLSADPAVGTESNTKASDVHQHFEIKSGKRSSPTVGQHSYTVLPDNKETDFHKTMERSGMRSELMVPFRRQADGCEREEERAASKSASTTVGNKGVNFATGSNSHMEARQEQECRILRTEERKQPDKSNCMSKTPEIKDGLANDKRKSSLNVSLTPELDNKPDLHCEVPSPETSPKPSFKENEDKGESKIDVKTEEEDGNGNNKVKVPMHKVRDVRRLVKNTYNLSFKASSAAIPSPKMEDHLENEEIHQDRREEITEERKPMQIECKAMCWKEDKDKMTPSRIEEGKRGDQRQASAQLSIAEASKPEGYLYGGPESHMTNLTSTSKPCESDANNELKEDSTEARNYTTPVEAKPETARRYKKPPMLGSLPKLPSKEREVSTAVVVIRDGFSKHKTVQDERPMPATALNSESSGHAVSMLLKEKGYQAEIGAVLNEGEQNTVGGKGMPHKHVNRLEIPLQICSTSEGGMSESQRERTFSTSSAKSTSTIETPPKMGEEEGVDIKPPMRDSAQLNIGTPLTNTGSQTVTPPIKLIEQKDFDALKRQDPTFPPRSPALRYKPQQIEVKSLSKETQKQKKSTNNLMLNKKSQSIEVKSISNNQTKPAVPPKPNYKFKPPDLGPLPNESQTSAQKTLNAKPQEREERPQTIVVSSPTIYRKLSSESTSASNYTRKLAVSAVSSCRPLQNKTTITVSSQSNSSALSDKEQSNDRAHHPEASPQSSSDTQNSTALAPALESATNPAITSEPGLNPGTNVSQISGSSSTVASGSGQSAVRADDLRFYSSDDPPSYDERESFSPLMLQGLTPKKPNRYFAAPRPPPCSCTSHAGLTPPQRHHSPHNHTPPASAHSPGHPHPYPIAPPPLRPHQCRAEPPPMCYQPSSPKSSPLGPGQPPTMYHPLNQPPSYPSHPSLMQPCPERPLQLHQHMETRRPSLHRSSQQQQQPGMSGVPYSDHGHGHSPGLPHLDSQYMCGPQGMGPSYGSEYEGDSSSMYSEGSFGQMPRRMLMDPETGKYFYIEVPVQPLRKMLFDPETGQYVEVLIPQQSMSHSGLYPPTAAPYPSMHNPNMYAPAPQYMQPYAAPPPQPLPPHPQTQPPLPTRHPDSSASTALHQNGAGVVYGGPSGQGSKMDPQTHQPLDQSYLEGMYYVPTGMNGSPNPPPPDCYHKHSPSPHSGAGGKRS
ncbi:unnamed protein product [Lota lota]